LRQPQKQQQLRPVLCGQLRKCGSTTTITTLIGGGERDLLAVPAPAVLAPQHAGQEDYFIDSDADTIVWREGLSKTTYFDSHDR
jgi:hypothetical protein